MDNRIILASVMQNVSRICHGLSEDEKRQISNMYRTIDKNIFKGRDNHTAIIALTKALAETVLEARRYNSTTHNRLAIEGLETKDSRNAETDMHEYLKSELVTDVSTDEEKQLYNNIQINSFLGIDSIYKLQLLFNPESLYEHFYLVVDSDYRVTTEENKTAITKFRWNYSPTQNLLTGFCNSVGTIKNVIGMRMYQPKVPYVSAMDTSAKRVSVLIEEFSAQAFIGENGRRFHFLLRPDYLNATTSIELTTEDYNDGIFKFRTPIIVFDSITISFGDPLELLTFASPFDRFMIPFEFVCYKQPPN